MRKKRKSRTWLWILMVIVLASVIGYFIISEKSPGSEEPLLMEKLASLETNVPAEASKNIRVENEMTSIGLTEETPAQQSSPNEDFCAQVDKNMANFFSYLNQKEYVQNPGSKKDTYIRFKNILNRLAAQLPVPAGEGADPKIIIQNINL